MGGPHVPWKPNRAALSLLPLLSLLAFVQLAAGDQIAVQPAREETAGEPRLPPEIAAFRRQLWSAKPAGQTFRLAVSDRMATETARWVLADRPDLPFSDPEVKIYPGGVAASATAEVLGQRIRVQGLARITLGENGRPELDIAELSVAGVETPELFLAPVRAALEKAEASFRRVPLKLGSLELEIGKATLAGTFRALKKDHFEEE